MNLIHKIAFDQEGLYDEVFYCDGQEITEEQFMGLEADLKSEEEVQCNCPDCTCDNEEEDLEDIIHNAVIDICNTGGCPYCIEDRIRLFMSDVLNYIEE